MSIYSNLSDEELIPLLKKGQEHAYLEIYDRYKAPLYVHAYNKLRDREDSRDIVQELFAHLWHNRQDLQIQSNVSAYLYAIVRNKVFRFISRKGLESSYISSIHESVNSGTCQTDHKVREGLMKEMIEREINALPAKMRQIFIMSRKEGLSHKEIAEQLDIAEPTVKKQVNNALKILRKRLGLLAYLVFLITY